MDDKEVLKKEGLCPVCENRADECICCPECGHLCALNEGELYCPVCGPVKPRTDYNGGAA